MKKQNKERTRALKEEQRSLKQSLKQQKEIHNYINDDGYVKDRNALKAIRNRCREVFTAIKDAETKEEPIKITYPPLTMSSLQIPVRDIKDGIIITTDNRFVRILEVKPISFKNKNEGDKELIIESFYRYLALCPSYLQIKSYCRNADIRTLLNKIDADIKTETSNGCKVLLEDYKKLIMELSKNEAVTRRFFLIFSYAPKEKSLQSYELAQPELLEWESQARKYLAECGNYAVIEEDTTHQQGKIMYDILNRSSSQRTTFGEHISEVIEEYKRKYGEDSINYIPVAEYLSPRKIDTRDEKYVVANGIFYSFMMLDSKALPTEALKGWFSSFINMGKGIDIDLFVEKQDKNAMLGKISRSLVITGARARSNAKTKNGVSKNLQDSLEGGQYINKRLKGSNENIFYTNVLITITAKSKKELLAKIKKIKDDLKTQDYGVNTLINKQDIGYFSSFPLHTIDKKIKNRTKRNILSRGLAGMYPFTALEMNDDDGIMWGVTEDSNALVRNNIFDTKKYMNANFGILGTSGAGKTYTINLLTSRLRRQKIQTFLIAPIKGHEYRRVCEQLDGSFIRLSSSTDNIYNILSIRPVDKEALEISKQLDVGYMETSVLMQKMEFLRVFFSMLFDDPEERDLDIIEEIIIDLYKDFGITKDNYSIYDKHQKLKLQPILSDFADKLQESGRLPKIADRLQGLIKSGKISCYNGQTNVDLDNLYVVIDVSGQKGKDMALATYVGIEFCWSRIKENRLLKKALFIDEIWQFIKVANNKCAELISEIPKIIRAFGGSFGFATQDIDDLDNEYGRAMISNSETKIMLRLKPNQAAIVKEFVGLTDKEESIVKKLQQGKALIQAGDNNVVIDFRASKAEHDLITTDRSDLSKQYKDKKSTS